MGWLPIRRIRGKIIITLIFHTAVTRTQNTTEFTGMKAPI